MLRTRRLRSSLPSTAGAASSAGASTSSGLVGRGGVGAAPVVPAVPRGSARTAPTPALRLLQHALRLSRALLGSADAFLERRDDPGVHAGLGRVRRPGTLLRHGELLPDLGQPVLQLTVADLVHRLRPAGAEHPSFRLRALERLLQLRDPRLSVLGEHRLGGGALRRLRQDLLPLLLGHPNLSTDLIHLALLHLLQRGTVLLGLGPGLLRSLDLFARQLELGAQPALVLLDRLELRLESQRGLPGAPPRAWPRHGADPSSAGAEPPSP